MEGASVRESESSLTATTVDDVSPESDVARLDTRLASANNGWRSSATLAAGIVGKEA